VILPRSLLLVALLSPLATAEELLGEIISSELGRRYDAALLRRGAASADPNVREAAARAAGRIRDEDALSWLLPLLRDDNGRVRRATLFALGQLGDDAVTLPLREAVAALPRSDRPHALEALGKTRDARAVATVVAYLTDSDPEVRNQAALALFRIGDDSATTELFAALLVEKNPEPRWRQVYGLFRLLRDRTRRTKKPVGVGIDQQQLLRASIATDRPFHERVFATMALGAIAGGDEWIVPLLGDEDARVVVSAVRGLSLGPVRDHPQALAAHLEHKNTLVREAIVDALIGWKATDALQAAQPKLRGRDAMKAHLALIDLGETPKVGPLFASDESIKEEWLCQLAAKTGSALPDPASLKTPDGLRAAAEACGSDKLPEADRRRALRKLLKNPDGTVRTMAVGVVAEQGWKDEAAHVIEAARTATGPEAVDVRMEAANALAKLEVADAWLKDAAIDPEFGVRQAARAALEKLGKPLPPNKPRAGLRLHDQDAPSIVAAAQALRGARVDLKTNRGTMTLILLPDEAPAHCVNFATLVTKGFYDNRSWHRVVADFVIQGGCPRGDGWGGPGYFLPDEIGTRPYVRGTVGMPKSGDDTGGCQIFITHLPTPHLDGRYTVYAQVIEGLAVIDKIRVGDRIEKATLRVRER
jgi:cyclophilin family peptidyl-prolyl cis-trans isomerase